jgi:alpha-galactosidase
MPALCSKIGYETASSALPDLVIECCSSGGHRLEASWLRLVSQASFSDLHEGRSIPIVAAALHRLIPVRMNQIWAVLRETDDVERLRWSLAAGLLGRLCISGDQAVLTGPQRDLIDTSTKLALAAAPVLAAGRTIFHGNAAEGSWSQPTGWQVIVRYNEDVLLIVAHAFAGTSGENVIDLPIACGAHVADLGGHIQARLKSIRRCKPVCLVTAVVYAAEFDRI